MLFLEAFGKGEGFRERELCKKLGYLVYFNQI